MYPSKFLNNFANPDDYTRFVGTFENKITPLGQRQSYLVGAELRDRYVNDTPLLNTDYLISQVYL